MNTFYPYPFFQQSNKLNDPPLKSEPSLTSFYPVHQACKEHLPLSRSPFSSFLLSSPSSSSFVLPHPLSLYLHSFFFPYVISLFLYFVHFHYLLLSFSLILSIPLLFRPSQFSSSFVLLHSPLPSSFFILLLFSQKFLLFCPISSFSLPYCSFLSFVPILFLTTFFPHFPHTITLLGPFYVFIKLSVF